MTYLKHSEYVDIGSSLPLDGSVRVVHSCKTSSHSKPLAIRRHSDGRITAKCFRCGKSGSYSKALAGRSLIKKRAEAYGSGGVSTGRGFVLPKDLNGRPSTWPTKAQVWPYRFGITERELIRYNIGWSEFLGRVVIPVYLRGDLVGYQSRKIDPHDTMPKYLSSWRDSTRCGVYTYQPTQHIVITEDVLSSIKVGRHCASYALMGTSINDTGLNLLTKRHSEYIIYLDNDNHIVKKKQRELSNRLKLFGSVRIIKQDKDPKELTDKELLECLSLK